MSPIIRNRINLENPKDIPEKCAFLIIRFSGNFNLSLRKLTRISSWPKEATVLIFVTAS